MATPGARMRLTIEVLPLATENAHGPHQAAAMDVFKGRKFAMPVPLEHTFAHVWRDLEDRYKRNYLTPMQAASFTIKKLQDAYDCDLDLGDTVASIFEGEPDLQMRVIKVIPSFINRDFSMPVTSNLRPSSAQKRTRETSEASEEAISKRRRLEEEQRELMDMDPARDEPIASRESEHSDGGIQQMPNAPTPPGPEHINRSRSSNSVVLVQDSQTGGQEFVTRVKDESPELGLPRPRSVPQKPLSPFKKPLLPSPQNRTPASTSKKRTTPLSLETPIQFSSSKSGGSGTFDFVQRDVSLLNGSRRRISSQEQRLSPKVVIPSPRTPTNAFAQTSSSTRKSTVPLPDNVKHLSNAPLGTVKAFHAEQTKPKPPLPPPGTLPRKRGRPRKYPLPETISSTPDRSTQEQASVSTALSAEKNRASPRKHPLPDSKPAAPPSERTHEKISVSTTLDSEKPVPRVAKQTRPGKLPFIKQTSAKKQIYEVDTVNEILISSEDPSSDSSSMAEEEPFQKTPVQKPLPEKITTQKISVQKASAKKALSKKASVPEALADRDSAEEELDREELAHEESVSEDSIHDAPTFNEPACEGPSEEEPSEGEPSEEELAEEESDRDPQPTIIQETPSPVKKFHTQDITASAQKKHTTILSKLFPNGEEESRRRTDHSHLLTDHFKGDSGKNAGKLLARPDDEFSVPNSAVEGQIAAEIFQSQTGVVANEDSVEASESVQSRSQGSSDVENDLPEHANGNLQAAPWTSNSWNFNRAEVDNGTDEGIWQEQAAESEPELADESRSRSSSAVASNRSSLDVTRPPARYLSHSPSPNRSEDDDDDEIDSATSRSRSRSKPTSPKPNGEVAKDDSSASSDSDDSDDTTSDEDANPEEDKVNEASDAEPDPAPIANQEPPSSPASLPSEPPAISNFQRPKPQSSQPQKSISSTQSAHRKTSVPLPTNINTPTISASQPTPKSSQSVSVLAAARRNQRKTYSKFPSISQQLHTINSSKGSSQQKNKFDPRTSNLSRLAKSKSKGKKFMQDGSSDSDDDSSDSSSSEAETGNRGVKVNGGLCSML